MPKSHRINYNLGRMIRGIPKRMDEAINDIADATTRDIRKGVITGVDLQGTPFEPLKPATVRAKRRKGSAFARKPLMDENRMAGGTYVQKRAKATSLSAKIVPPKDRAKIGAYHLKGDGNNPVREWWGVGKRVPVSRILRRSGVKTVRDARA